MKRILYLVPYQAFVPLYFELSRYLAGHGYEACFAAFLLREHTWLRKNGLPVEPPDVYAVASYPIKNGVLSAREVRDIVRFSAGKAGGARGDWKVRVRRIASYLDDLLDERRFDAVVIWNGQELAGKTLATLAARRGIKTVFAENGYFPNTLQLDLRGVNAESSVNGLPFAEIRRAAERPRDRGKAPARAFELSRLKPLSWTDLARCFVARKVDPAHYRRFPEHLGSTWFASKWLDIRRALVPADRGPLPAKFVFIPLQVHDDTQILLNCRSFSTMEKFLEISHAAVRRVFGDEYAIVVKEHPEDLCRRSYARLRGRFPDVLWLRKYSVDELIERAACVFVVNSSVGLQALARGKPTVVFGDSFYARDEIVFKVDDLANLDEVVRRAGAGITPERSTDIDSFIRFLEERYFVAAGWKRVTAAGVVNAGNRILELIEPAAPAPSAPEREPQACIRQI